MTRTAIGLSVLGLFFAGVVSASDAEETAGSKVTQEPPVVAVPEAEASSQSQPASASMETVTPVSWTPPVRPAPRAVVSSATRGGDEPVPLPAEAP